MVKTRSYRQRPSGQALIEGTAFLMILVPIIVFGIVLNLVTTTLGYYHLKLAQIADAGARAAINERYWLGAQRPDYDEGTAAARVAGVCSSLYSKAGLPGHMTGTADFSDPKVVKVTVRASALPVWSAGFLPPVFSMEDTAAEPYNIERPIGLLGLSFKESPLTIPPGSCDGVMGMILPTYGAGAMAGTCGSGMTPGPRGEPYDCGSNIPYWHSSPWSAEPQKPVTGPFANYGMNSPFPGY